MKRQSLEAALGYSFRQPELLRQALTHRGFGTPNNERLEFLGDSVLSCVIANNLYRRFPLLKEGQLHLLRVGLVRQAALAEIATSLRLGEFLLLDKNAIMSGSAKSPAVLSDALEAIFGAIFLDGGFDRAHEVISMLHAAAIDRIDPGDVGKDPKTELQEILHQRRLPHPIYSLVATRGEDHAKEFDVECTLQGVSVKTLGSGRSRRIAEQQAARLAIAELKS
jgi:ribonuclease-3